MGTYDLNKLEVYNRAEKLADEIWVEVQGWNDNFSKDTIGKQLVKAADSIGANIAEGYGRYHYKENKNFCYFSRGSLMEAKGWLKKTKSRNLISAAKVDQYLEELDHIHRMLNAYIRVIGSQNSTTNTK